MVNSLLCVPIRKDNSRAEYNIEKIRPYAEEHGISITGHNGRFVIQYASESNNLCHVVSSLVETGEFNLIETTTALIPYPKNTSLMIHPEYPLKY